MFIILILQILTGSPLSSILLDVFEAIFKKVLQMFLNLNFIFEAIDKKCFKEVENLILKH